MKIGWLGLIGCNSKSKSVSVSDVLFNTEQIPQGPQLYAQYCASCHEANGEGQFHAAPLLPDQTGRFGAPPHNGNGHTSHIIQTIG